MTLPKGMAGPRPLLISLFALGIAAGMTGCSSTGVRLDGETPDKSVQRGHASQEQALSRAEADKRLIALGIVYRRVPDVEHERGCSIQDAVEVTRVGQVQLTRPALLTQDMAIRFGRWVQDVLEPEAQKTFGSQLAAIDVGGTYSCRNIYGKPFGGRFAGRLSEHAFANAVDIGGYRLANGREVDYLKHWRAKDGSSQFLQATSLSACEIFNTTLTPDYDRFHRNHIHLDASPKKEDANKFCGVRGRFSPGDVPAFARYKVPAKKKIIRTRKPARRA